MRPWATGGKPTRYDPCVRSGFSINKDARTLRLQLNADEDTPLHVNPPGPSAESARGLAG